MAESAGREYHHAFGLGALADRARVFRAVVPAAATEGPGAVAALNDAFVKVAREIVVWAARAV